MSNDHTRSSRRTSRRAHRQARRRARRFGRPLSPRRVLCACVCVCVWLHGFTRRARSSPFRTIAQRGRRALLDRARLLAASRRCARSTSRCRAPTAADSMSSPCSRPRAPAPPKSCTPAPCSGRTTSRGSTAILSSAFSPCRRSVVAARAPRPTPATLRRCARDPRPPPSADPPFERGSPRGLALSRSLSLDTTPARGPVFSTSRLLVRFVTTALSLMFFVRSVFRVTTTSVATRSHGGQLDLRAFDALDDAALGELWAYWPEHTSIFVASGGQVSAAAKEKYGCSEPLFDDAETAKFYALFRKHDRNQSDAHDASELKARRRVSDGVTVIMAASVILCHCAPGGARRGVRLHLDRRSDPGVARQGLFMFTDYITSHHSMVHCIAFYCGAVLCCVALCCAVLCCCSSRSVVVSSSSHAFTHPIT